VAIPEAQFFVDCMPVMSTDSGFLLDSKPVISSIKKHYRFKIWNYDFPEFDRGYASYQDIFEHLVRDYALSRHGKSPLFWVDHQPGHVKHIHKIKKYYPDVKVIHIVRDGRAVANSLIPLDWGPNCIHKAAYYWEQRIAYGLALEKYLDDDQITMVRYEDLVEMPDREVKRICGFLGINYQPGMINGGGLNVPAFTKKQHKLVGQSPSSRRVSAWESTMTEREIQIFESISGALLNYLGYRTSDKATLPLSGIEKMILEFKHVVRVIVNKVKFEYRIKRYTGSENKQG
jgi:hypothetical protein